MATLLGDIADSVECFGRGVKGRDRNALKGEFRMGSRSPLCGVLAAALAVTASAPQRLPVESDQQVLIKLERGWNEAVYRKDVAFIANILADEFIATYDDGSRGDKAKELALVAEFNQRVESATQDEFTVKVYGDAAVVWFTLHLVGTKQGQRAELTLRYTDVWVVRDGGWVCVSTQSTRVNPKQAAACLRCFSMSDALTRYGENRRSTMGSLENAG